MTLGAALWMYLGIGIWMGSSVLVILTVIVFSGLLTFIYFHETRELAARFGEEYLQYKSRTPFFAATLPTAWLNKESEKGLKTHQISPSKGASPCTSR